MSDTPRTDAVIYSFVDEDLWGLELKTLTDHARDLERENAALRKTGNALREYLVSKVGPIEDIPDEIFQPFIAALEVKP